MSASDYVLIIGAVVTLVGAIAAGAVSVIRATRENTTVTKANTAAVTGEPPPKP